MTLEYRLGDVRDRLAEIPDGTIDLIVTSPPFLALRSYLPADHPDKHREIGSEATPADFLDTLLGLSAEWGRVLAPHGSLCVELGDTYSGSTQTGGDFIPGSGEYSNPARLAKAAQANGARRVGAGWPLAKSMTGIPTLYPWSLAYGRNLLTGQPSPAGQWRIRNLIVWARPNPPVGALGDKFRPATSYITVACRGAKRYFDLDAVRTESVREPRPNELAGKGKLRREDGDAVDHSAMSNPSWVGTPPLDWHTDHHPEDGDWLWKMSTQPYPGSHYATFPMALPKRLIEAMCPLRVCRECGRPSERIVEREQLWADGSPRDALVPFTTGAVRAEQARGYDGRVNKTDAIGKGTSKRVDVTTLGWSDCGHNNWRTGVVLDPFAGSGTTLEAAQAVGRHAIGIDLDHRNADLARDRVGMFLTIEGAA